jgi:hypothetical protein
VVKERKILEGLKVDYSLSADELILMLKKHATLNKETENYLRQLILAEEEKGHKKSSHRNLHLFDLVNSVGFYQLSNFGRGQNLGQVSVHEAIFVGIHYSKSGRKIFPFIDTIHLIGKPEFIYFETCSKGKVSLKKCFSYGANQDLTRFLLAEVA